MVNQLTSYEQSIIDRVKAERKRINAMRNEDDWIIRDNLPNSFDILTSKELDYLDKHRELLQFM